MSIVYVNLNIEVYGIKLVSEAMHDEFNKRVQRLISGLAYEYRNAERPLDVEVDVECEEHAGAYDE